MRAIAWFLSSILCFSSYALYADDLCSQQACMAVIDAGSTGTRLHIYSYELDKNQTPIHITERWSNKISPGIATLDANQENIDQYLRSLFLNAPAGEHLPTYFYATAGMRLLPKPKQQAMYAFIGEWFNGQTNMTLAQSKTITGAEEGLYGWLAVNYQLGTLDKSDAAIGTLDMGGASVQVVFPVKNSNAATGSDIYAVTLYGRHFNLFIHSFLGLGQTEVAHQLFDSSSCFITNYELPSGQLAEGDAYTCKDDVSTLLNAVHHVDKVVQPVVAANPVKKWYVMGGLVDLVKSPLFNFTGETLTNQSLLEKANNELCHQDWSNLSTQYPSDNFLFGYCLFPSYFYALMVDGYGIAPQEKLNYLKDDQSNDWTLGVVLHPIL